MKRVSKFLSIAATTLAMTGTAFADDPPAGGDAAGGGDAGAGAGSGTATPAAGGDTGVTAGMYTKENWPKASIDRPLTAAASMIEVAPIFNYGHAKDAMGNSSDSTGVSVVGRYGVSDKLEILFAYGSGSAGAGAGGLLSSGIHFTPGDFEAKGNLTVGAGFGAISGGAGGKLDVEIKGAFSYNLLFKPAVISLGADVRYKITPKIYVGTPINTPGLVIFADGGDLMAKPIFFDLPLALGFQATPELALQVNTALAHFKINDDAGANAFIFADNIPLSLDVLYGLSNKMDIRVNLNLGDLKTIGDTNAIGVNAGVNVRL